MNTTVHPAEAINPQAAVSELKSAGASLRYSVRTLVSPMLRAQYEAMARERAAEGFGAFCGSYEGYVAVCEEHNAKVRAVMA